MKKIYLVRHGETKSNAARIVQGYDDELSAVGLAQAEQLTARLKTLSFDRLLVSDYVRTRQTVAPLLPHIKVQPNYTPLVRETRQPSSLIGTSNLSDEFQHYYQLVTTHLHDPAWRFEDEETFYDVAARVRLFMDEMTRVEGTTVVVTHGRFIIYVVMYVLTGAQLTPETWQACRHGFETTNTGITTLQYSDAYASWKLLTFNDQAHFAE